MRSVPATDQSPSKTDPPGYDETMSNGRTESLLVLEENSSNLGILQGERNIADFHANDNMLETAVLANSYNSQQAHYADDNRNSFEQQLLASLKDLQVSINFLNHGVTNKKVSKYV